LAVIRGLTKESAKTVTLDDVDVVSNDSNDLIYTWTASPGLKGHEDHVFVQISNKAVLEVEFLDGSG
jgi:hypothetical protein